MNNINIILIYNFDNINEAIKWKKKIVVMSESQVHLLLKIFHSESGHSGMLVKLRTF